MIIESREMTKNCSQEHAIKLINKFPYSCYFARREDWPNCILMGKVSYETIKTQARTPRFTVETETKYATKATEKTANHIAVFDIITREILEFYEKEKLTHWQYEGLNNEKKLNWEIVIAYVF